MFDIIAQLSPNRGSNLSAASEDAAMEGGNGGCPGNKKKKQRTTATVLEEPPGQKQAAYGYIHDSESTTRLGNNDDEFTGAIVVASTAAAANAAATTTITTSHDVENDDEDDDKKLTQIDTVTLKCDLNDYLINLITVSCSLTQSGVAERAAARAGAEAQATANKYPAVGNPASSYIPFDELVRCTEREREWSRTMARTPLPRMRLCGGGEDSINNGTSAWGTPPGPASNGAVSAWGVLPNQPQQPIPPLAWGGSNSSNNNNNNTGASNNSQPGVNSTSNGNGSAGNNNNNNNNNVVSNTSGGGRGGGSSTGDPSFNKTNAQSAQSGGSQLGTSPPNAWNTVHRSAGGGQQQQQQQQASVANNNGNHHHHHHHHNQNHSHHHQQQQAQQQQPTGGQNQGNNGANNNNGGPTKNQLEVLNTMREALFAQDGWGCQHVNQDTNWEVPGSPEPPGASAATGGGGAAAGAAGSKGDGGGGGAGSGGPNWKPQTMNNGTELWETNLRNGSAAPNQQQQQQQATAKPVPWVPANNLGGTWMEDDDGAAGVGGTMGIPPDGVNVWNGNAASIVAGTVPPMGAMAQVGGGSAPWSAPVAGGNVAGGMWPPGTTSAAQNPATMSNPQVVAAAAAKKELNEWGATGGMQQQPLQQPPQAQQQQGGILVVPPNAGVPVTAAGTGGLLAQGWGDARTATPGGLNLAGSIGGGGELRGDPRGISGRLNAAGAMGWGGGGADHMGPGVKAAGGPGILPSAASTGGTPGQPWGGAGQTSNNGVVPNKLPGGVGGWDDGTIRGAIPGVLDDATGGGGAMLWGNGAVTATGAGILARQNSSGWKDVGSAAAADQMLRGTGGGHLGRNQHQQQAGGPFGSIPGAGSAIRYGAGGLGSLGKPDAMWGQGNPTGIPRNGSWEDGPGGGWGGEDKIGGANLPWNVDLGANGIGGGGWNKTPTTPKSAGSSGGTGGWPDPNDLTSAATTGLDWGGGLGGKQLAANSNNKQQPGLGGGNPLEFIRASKEYRLLCEMGHKKEDVEFSLRATGMIFDDAMDLLRHGGAAPLGLPGSAGGGWRRPDASDHAPGMVGMGGYDAAGPYSGRIPPLNHAASGLSFSQNNQSMLNNIPGGPGVLGGLDGGPNNLAALNNLKYLSQQQQQSVSHPSFSHGSLLPPGAGGRGQQTHQQQQQQQQLAAAAAAQPSNQQLRMLVQQIQLAVQNGFLNHQILNQPLAPQTLVLLNQLLNHIKQMQLTQSNLARSGATAGVSAVQLTLAINKHKTQIAQLQQQIAAQQSLYLKQQQQAGGPGLQGSLGPPPLMQSNPAALGMDFLRQQQHQQQQQQDLMALQGNFGELALGKDASGVFPPPVVPPQQQQQHATTGSHMGGGSTSQQSRLNQWKLPSLEKDPSVAAASVGKDDLTDFSRAPGPTGSGAKAQAGSNLASLGLVQDGTWTTGRSNLTDGGWPEQAGESDSSKDWTTATTSSATVTTPTTANNIHTSSQDNSAAAFTDLVVPEFEPGKPWKGTQLKIEDDPSITPGSVARSPLSIATAKAESELFGGGVSASEKMSPSSAVAAAVVADLPGADGGAGGLNLSSSAWSFNNTPSSTGAVGTAGKSIDSKSVSVWTADGASGGSSSVAVSSADVWCLGKPTATRGPPPGLGGTVNKGGNGSGASWSSGAAGSQRGSWGTGTSWLLLKNLTSQIDASTLRTLCMQHGPIVSFHSYPSHGLALCRYNTREEATKAQQALNNCPLGTGTISAECPGTESEVQTYLQQLAGSSGGGAATAVSSSSAGSISSISSQSWRQRGSASGAGDTWGSGWPLGGSAVQGTGPGSGGPAAATNLWAPLDGTDQGTPSSLNSFLPESLLGPELN